jgi:hypothetical protein
VQSDDLSELPATLPKVAHDGIAHLETKVRHHSLLSKMLRNPVSDREDSSRGQIMSRVSATTTSSAGCLEWNRQAECFLLESP